MLYPLSAYLALAVHCVRLAGDHLRRGFGQNHAVNFKGAVDLVTRYDHDNEALIINTIRAAYPDHTFLGEESGRSAEGAYQWIIDPLDGTTNFAHGFPMFAVSVALRHHSQLLVGAVYDPLRDELFTGALGQGAYLNGVRLQVSPQADISRALLATGFPYDVRTNPRNFAEFERFYRHSQAVRRAGAAALDACYVAAGRLEGYWEYDVKPWDIAAATLMVREAGGRVTDHLGGEDALGQAGFVASNGLIHATMLDILRETAGL